jgi:hypothetical protein
VTGEPASISTGIPTGIPTGIACETYGYVATYLSTHPPYTHSNGFASLTVATHTGNSPSDGAGRASGRGRSPICPHVCPQATQRLAGQGWPQAIAQRREAPLTREERGCRQRAPWRPPAASTSLGGVDVVALAGYVTRGARMSRQCAICGCQLNADNPTACCAECLTHSSQRCLRHRGVASASRAGRSLRPGPPRCPDAPDPRARPVNSCPRI